MNKIELFYNELQEKAIKMGFESIEIFFKKTLEFSTKIFRGEIEKYQNTEESGISIRGIYKGKIGYYYSEKIDEEIIEDALLMIIDNSELIEVKDEMILKDKFEIDIEVIGYIPQNKEITMRNFSGKALVKLPDDNPAYVSAEKMGKKIFKY